MAKKIVIKKQPIAEEQLEEKKLGFFSYLRFGESYTSLILGVIVVIVATALLLSFVHNKNAGNINAPVSQDAKTNVEMTHKMLDLEKTAPSLVVDNVLPTETPAQLPTNEPTQTPQPTSKPKPTQKPAPTNKPRPTVTSKPKPTMAPKPTEVAKKPEPTKAPQKTKPTNIPQVKTDKDNNIWTVQKGESLWSIAEQKYNNGYNWVDIARANNLSNPGQIHAGDKLKLPSVKSNEQTIATVTTKDENNAKTVREDVKQPTPVAKPSPKVNKVNTVQPNQMAKITSTTYDVQRGDNLWNIAVRAYGDGYRWNDIARANGLTNPRVIHAGNHFTIPR